DPQEAAAIIVFVTDEFGNPVAGHTLVGFIEAGSGTLLHGGRLQDDGALGSAFRDAYSTDGVYIGEYQASAISREPVRLRILDLTDPTQPTATVELQVR
ncbi:MAG: hypothetical protein HY335_10645, partial [Deinococcus sp.]|nr:hypothetical protein [Deinococcus sp.]